MATELGHAFKVLGSSAVDLFRAGLELDVAGFALSEMIRQALGRGVHVTGRRSAPLRPILGAGGEAQQSRSGDGHRHHGSYGSENARIHVKTNARGAVVSRV